MKTDKELYDIAIGIKAGTIFTDRHVENKQDMSYIFMPLGLMNKKQLKELGESDIGMIYEHIDNAGPRSINGYPGFFSFQILTMEETKQCMSFLEKLDIVPSDNSEL